MIQKALAASLTLVLCFNSAVLSRADNVEELRCGHTYLRAAPIDSSDHRKYAPSREIDILHLTLDVTPDFKKRTVAGKATLRFKPIAQPFQELRLNAVDLNVQSVTATEKIQAQQVTDKEVIVTFSQPIAPDKEASVTIAYEAEPRQGLYFRTPEMGYKAGDTHLFTQGEAIEARHWYPCFDSPNEKFTSEITCRVPEGMTVLSNGKLISEEKDAASGLVAVRWHQDKPHVNYLLSLLAGYFKKIEDQYKDIPLAFYTPPSEINEATNSFQGTKDMMAFFEQEIGVPYPWSKYYQVCVNDFVAGGMENTSITTLTDYTLFTTNTENIRSSQGLVAHELAHQWFGDLVTCKDWSHIWLNEGFATYYAHLYDGHKDGRDDFLYGMFNSARGFLDMQNETKPIVYRKYDAPMEQFSYLAYPKGGWVLHMLRSQLGEDLYRRCIKTYLERHQYDTVVTEDLNAVIEELSGRSFDQFFDQWVYHAHHPELEIAYSWDEKTKLAKVSIKQNQKLSEDVLLFNFPLTVRFKSKAKTVDRQITIKEKAEDFYFPLEAAPEVVRIDPNYTLLAKISFTPPNPMLYAQLADKDDMMGRLLAVLQLAGRKDKETIAKLKEALNNDSFYGIRLEASKALRSIHTEDALEALLASTKQADARVRRQVLADVTGFYEEKVYAAARQSLESEKNPDILSHAIGALGAYAKPEVRETLLRYLNSESYRNSLADAAINAMRAQDDPAYLAPLRESLAKREAELSRQGLTRGLDTLAYLARNQEKKDEEREFLIRYLPHKKRNVPVAAINALGTLGDPKAIAVLETFARAGKESPERSAAERAIASLRAARKPVDDFQSLRNEVLDLKKENRDLRKEMDDLKKKVGALPGPQAAPQPKAKSKKPALPPKAARR
ncbi:MAG: HEAT repeat domain-containing protein [Chloroflexi bacterium]|nr:HEAT repeat domain-containing protein [Chloroflexota bacterium]